MLPVSRLEPQHACFVLLDVSEDAIAVELLPESALVLPILPVVFLTPQISDEVDLALLSTVPIVEPQLRVFEGDLSIVLLVTRASGAE